MYSRTGALRWLATPRAARTNCSQLALRATPCVLAKRVFAYSVTKWCSEQSSRGFYPGGVWRSVGDGGCRSVERSIVDAIERSRDP